MDISLPYKWIQEYIRTDIDAKTFARETSLGGPSIEKYHYDEELDDNILDIEVTSNRPDMASVIGIAREGSAIMGHEFLYRQPTPVLSIKNNLELTVFNEEKDLCKRYQAVVMEDVTVTESPDWMKKRLLALGMNSINLLVDISNYVMLEYGQPTHIFDYDKVANHTIKIRKAKKGEKITTLDKKDYVLDESVLVIADNENPIAIAGIKGGLSTGVSMDTKRIVIESGNFEATNVRKTARNIKLQTDAASLFEKNLNTESTYPALMRVIELVAELAGGRVASDIKDERKEAFEPNVINLNTILVKRILGLDIPISEIEETLTKLQFEVEILDESNLKVTVPYFRTEDIVRDYDLVEEIARIYGYHRIPSILPDGEIPIFKTPMNLQWEEKVKDLLAAIGYSEAFSYAMINEKHLQAGGISEDQVLSLQNPLTSDYLYIKNELTTTMIENVGLNEDYTDQVRLFELNRVFLHTPGSNDLPIEQSTLAIAINGKDKSELFYELKGVWEYLLQYIGIDKNNINYSKEEIKKPYLVGFSGSMNLGETTLGTIGIIDDNAKKIFGIKSELAVIEINFDNLYKIIEKTAKSFEPIAKYPHSQRDFSFLVDNSLEWKDVRAEIMSITGELFKETELIEIYKGKGIPEGKKSIVFSVILQSEDRTLTDEEVNELSDKLVERIRSKFSAQLR